jgi:hypothetical protein
MEQYTDMINIFKTQPEWMQQDTRIGRPIVVPSPGKPGGDSLSYNINADFMYDRHRVMLPPDLIKDKTILDVGCYMGATGAWALANGARHYTGIDARQKDLELGAEIFKKYFQKNQYTLIETWVEKYESKEKYDIVIASGVMYGVFDSFDFVKRIANFSQDIIIVDNVHPFNGYRRLFPNATDEQRQAVSKTLSIIQPSERIRFNSKNEAKSIRISASIISLQALILLMKNVGFRYDDSLYQSAEKEIEYYYDIRKHNRYMSKFVKDNSTILNTYEKALDNPNTETVIKFWRK